MLYHFHAEWRQPRVRTVESATPGCYCLFFEKLRTLAVIPQGPHSQFLLWP